MKIKDAAQATGLTKKTIRFYEAQGLFVSQKQWQNGREYHDYTEENVKELQGIAALRRARFSVEEIRRMLQAPGDTGEIFAAYRTRLREEARDLRRVLAAAETIDPATLTSAEDLIARMEPATETLPLPAVDVHPRFRYLDELEEAYTMRKKKAKMTEEERRQHRIAAENAAMYAAFSAQNAPGNNMAAGGKGGGMDIGNAQKIAAHNLLMNSREE